MVETQATNNLEEAMRILLDPKAYDELVEMLEQKPRSMPKLEALLNMDSPFASEEDECITQ